MDYYDLDYEDSLSGDKVVIFLHGWGRNKNDFKYFYDNVKSSKIRCINFSLYGFGKSNFPQNINFDTYEYAFQIYLFLKNKNIDSCYIVAHSFGCRIAFILTSFFDIKIQGMLLTGAAGIKPRFNFVVWLKIKIYKIKKKFSNRKIKTKNSLDRTFVSVVNQHIDFLLKYINCKNLVLFWGKKDRETPKSNCNIITKQCNCKNVKIKIVENFHFSFLYYKSLFLSYIYNILSETL